MSFTARTAPLIELLVCDDHAAAELLFRIFGDTDRMKINFFMRMVGGTLGPKKCSPSTHVVRSKIEPWTGTTDCYSITWNHNSLYHGRRYRC